MESEPQPFDRFLKDKAKLLIENIEQGEIGTAVQELITISDARNNSIYQQIGKITRGLHDAIASMEINKSKDNEGRDMPTRVDYVINLTQEAADKTMDLAELATPIAAELGTESKHLRHDWRKLKDGQLNAEEFRKLYQRIDDFLAYSEDKSNLLHTHLTDIVVAQGYQDLTGQVLKKIIEMLHTTETSLVTLLAISGRMQAESGQNPTPSGSGDDGKDLLAEGPLPDGATTLNDQAEVDDLLSSLGF